jgi:hypothetical protein
MTDAARPLDRVVTEWLRADAPSAARPEILARSLERVAVLPQDRPIGAPLLWRTGQRIGVPARFAASIVVVILAVIAVAGLLRPAQTIGPVPSPQPTPTVLPTRHAPAINPSSQPDLLPGGPFTLEPTFDVPVAIHLLLPDGWHQAGWALQKSEVESYVSFWTVENTYIDPCHWQTTAVSPPVGPSVADLVAALRGQKGRTVSEPTPVTIGGFSGELLTLEAPGDIGQAPCDQGEYRNWVGPGAGDASRFVPVDSAYAGYIDSVWILDVHGFRLVVDVTEAPTITQLERAEARGIVDSLAVDDISSGVRYGSCTLTVSSDRNGALAPPYEVKLNAGPGAPAATISAHGTGWGADGPGRPEVSLRNPNGELIYPGVGLGAGNLDFSQELDAPGTWRLRVMAWGVGCLVDVPIEVLPADSG